MSLPTIIRARTQAKATIRRQMRLAGAAFFAAALCAVPCLSGAAPSPAPPLRIIPISPPPATLPLPRSLSLYIPKQGFYSTALANFSLSSVTGSVGHSAATVCKTTNPTTVTLTAGSANDVTLQRWCDAGLFLKEVDVFQPPSTMNVFTNVVITSFTATGGTETFSFAYQQLKSTTITMNRASDSWNAP